MDEFLSRTKRYVVYLIVAVWQVPGTVAGPWDILFPFSSVGDEKIGPLMYGPGTSKKQKNCCGVSADRLNAYPMSTRFLGMPKFLSTNTTTHSYCQVYSKEKVGVLLNAWQIGGSRDHVCFF